VAKKETVRGKDIGARISLARKEQGGMSQIELGDLLGVSARSIQAYETGEVIPYRFLRDLERALNKPSAWFLYGEDALRARDEQFEELLGELRALRRAVDALAADSIHSGRPQARRSTGNGATNDV
jgi:transcriptional regulator with XRE-family HTH domain